MQQTGTINDVKQDVLDALQGRTDVSDSMIARYVAKAAKELCESQPFPELEATGPTQNLIVGEETYPVSQFVNTGDTYSSAKSFVIFIDFPNNTVTNTIKYKTMAGIETLVAPAVQGIPAWFTRFDTNFLFGPVPNNTYTVFLRYQQEHPTTATPSLNDPLYLPKSWYDILAYAAAQRIAIPKRWTDQAQYLHDVLYGDPEFINSQGLRGRPGLIAARTFQQERDQPYNSRSLTPVVARVNPR